MEGEDPWSMLKCAGGVQNKTITNRTMLRFRPIAPKPVTGDSVSRDSMFSNKNLVVASKRAKRKYVRVCKKNNMKRRILDESKENKDGEKSFVTLQLIPEEADLEKSMVGEGSLGVVDDLNPTVGNNYYFQEQESPSMCLKLKKVVADDVAMMGLSDQTALVTSPRKRTTVMESWVKVESVTDTCMDEGEMRNCTDFEKMKNLEKDTCPGFVSDTLNRVFWVNQAFKNMVGVDAEGVETAIGLVVKDGFMFPHGAFSCRVGLQYGDGKDKSRKHSTMVPCDVWKMSCGGFAWRLDVKAALSLGL
ncbi:uncharacterized protein LOC111315904 [Durio zibethinus]|uniref:Uncharacterized protein LOC111315904 n=1 Tax=Durio zibethinus TaxID=66656 RepID=A0A6P6B8Z8_DURZI|nr:uncharacterized protein LOC111315904 [Durio zibethinus]